MKDFELPITALEQAATFVHELYESFLRTGFTAEQSLRLSMSVLQQIIANNRPDGADV